MKLFLDVTPFFEPRSRYGAAVARGLMRAAVGFQDAYCLYREALLPRAFVAWAADQRSAVAGGRKIGEGVVQRGRLELALERYRGETQALVLIEPDRERGPSGEDLVNRFDFGVGVIADPTAGPPDPRLSLLCCMSQAAARRVEAAMSVHDRRLAIVALTPSPTPRFPSGEEPAPDGARRKTAVVVAEGGPRDNLELVARAWSTRSDALADWRLLIVRDPGAAPRAGEAASAPTTAPAFGDDVDMRRVGSDAGVRQLLAEAGVAIDASLGDPVGLWAREAQRFGAPVLAAVGGGAEEFLRDDGAIFFDPCAPADLGRALNLFASATWPADDRQTLARQARLGEMSWDDYGARVLDTVGSFAAGRIGEIGRTTTLALGDGVA